jgi:hypothetical protein
VRSRLRKLSGQKFGSHWEAHITRSAIKHSRKQRLAETGTRGRVAAAGRTQERLWAECIAAQPDIIADIVTFIAAARTQLVESPPLSPGDEPTAGDAEMTGKRRK